MRNEREGSVPGVGPGRAAARHRDRREPIGVEAELSALEQHLQSVVARRQAEFSLVHVDHRSDAVNLVHYLALRQHDVHGLQRRLSERGLSSLGRCEPHVMATVLSIDAMVRGESPEPPEGMLTFEEGRAALDANTDLLFGARPRGRVPRIMVTLDSQFAQDEARVRRLVAAGMDVARINGAHDGPAQWERMADLVGRAAGDLGRTCRIVMDLAGPKVRTGPLEEGPRVLRLRPSRDLRGRVVSGAIFALRAEVDADRTEG